MANRVPEHPELHRRVDATVAASEGLTTVASSARTHAQQKALFAAFLAGTGNLAADPDRVNPTTGRRGSNHQVQKDGLSYAVDISVSPKTAENKARLERIANDNGLIRTVPSEYWHFEMMGADGRAHRFGELIPAWAGGALCRRARGLEVENLQIFLVGQKVLTKPPAFGVFGPATEVAVKAWQRKLGVPETGCWDRATEQRTTAAGLGLGGPIEEEEEIEMLLVSFTNQPTVLISGGKVAIVLDQTELKKFQDAGIRLVHVSRRQYDEIRAKFG